MIPQRRPPDVWLKRLGTSAAAQRWQSSDGQRWWMVWLQDGSLLLVLLSTEASEPWRVSSSFPDVELLFADELHRKSFFSSLPSRPSTPSSVENQCTVRLSQSTAVAWNPSGLSSIAGPLAFALHSASYGCLTLTLDDRRMLMFDGAVSSRPLLQHNGLYGAPLIRNQYLRRLLIPSRRTIGLLSIGKALQQSRSSDHFFNAD